LNPDICFADPHTPWQHGSHENTNGLLHEFLRKGMDLSTVTQIPLNDIAKLLNGRPRQALGWHSPEKAMAKRIGRRRFAKRLHLALDATATSFGNDTRILEAPCDALITASFQKTCWV
jgi:hypothetical protein